MSGETKVQFSLWAVLTFLCSICILLFADVYATQRTLAEKKLDKVEYAEDQREIKETLQRIDTCLQNQATALIVHDPRMAPYLKKGRTE